MSTPHLDDIGTIFRFTILDQAGDVVNISSPTSIKIIFTDPAGTQISKTAALTTDGQDGQLEYVSIANDLDTVGDWKMQAQIVITAGTFHTDVESFKVQPNL